MRIAGLDELQAEIKTARRNSNNLRYTNDTALMAESKEELKNLLMRVKEGSEKVGSKLNIKKLTSWHLAPSLHGVRECLTGGFLHAVSHKSSVSYRFSVVRN